MCWLQTVLNGWKKLLFDVIFFFFNDVQFVRKSKKQIHLYILFKFVKNIFNIFDFFSLNKGGPQKFFY